MSNNAVCAHLSTDVAIYADGVLHWRGHNLLTTAGLQHIADQLSAVPDEATMGWIAFGDVNTAPTVSNTALGNEVVRVALSSSGPNQGTGGNASSVTYEAQMSGADVALPATLREFGIFNAASGGTMLDRSVFEDYVLTTAAQTVTIIVTLHITGI
jgi:hypothetical protein